MTSKTMYKASESKPGHATLSHPWKNEGCLHKSFFFNDRHVSDMMTDIEEQYFFEWAMQQEMEKQLQEEQDLYEYMDFVFMEELNRQCSTGTAKAVQHAGTLF